MKMRSVCAAVAAGLVAVSAASGAVTHEIIHTGSNNPQTEGWQAIDIVASTSVEFNYLSRPGIGPVNDGGVDAWQINTVSAYTSAYWATGLPGGNALLTNHWRFSAKVKALPTDDSLNSAMRVWAYSHSDSLTRGVNWLITLEDIVGGGTRVQMTGAAGGTNVDLVVADGYRWIELIYSPDAGGADLYIDGNLVQADAAYNSNTPAPNRVEFGDLILVGGGYGGANWNYASFGYDDEAFSPVAVPEPASLAAIVGVAGLLIGRKRR